MVGVYTASSPWANSSAEPPLAASRALATARAAASSVTRAWARKASPARVS